MPVSPRIKLVDHPLVQHKLGLLRRRQTSMSDFQRLIHEVAVLLGCEVTRDLALAPRRIEMTLETMNAVRVNGGAICFISILRAGNGPLA